MNWYVFRHIYFDVLNDHLVIRLYISLQFTFYHLLRFCIFLYALHFIICYAFIYLFTLYILSFVTLLYISLRFTFYHSLRFYISLRFTFYHSLRFHISLYALHFIICYAFI